MSRLTEWCGRIARIQARKKVSYRRYRSEALALKIEQVADRKRVAKRSKEQRSAR
ncbi:MAG: hypothetical protein ACLFU8_01495 [Anaerolineales bacterium]